MAPPTGERRARRRGPASFSEVFVLFVPATVVLLGLAVYLPLDTATEGLEEAAQARVRGAAELSRDHFGRQMAELADLVQSHAAGQALGQALGSGRPGAVDLPDLQAELHSLRRATPDLQSALFVDAEGRLVGASPRQAGLADEDFTTTDFFSGAIETDGPHVAEVVLTADREHPRVVTVAIAVRATEGGSAGEVVGVLGASLDVVASLQSFVDDFARTEGVDLVVVDQRGIKVAQPGADPGALESMVDDAGLRDALLGRAGVYTDDGTATDGEPVLEAFAPLPDIGWVLGASLPTEVASAPVTDLRREVLAVALAIGLLMGACLLMLARTLAARGAAERALRAERSALEHSNARFQSMLAAATAHAIMGADDHGLLTVFNEGAERIFGYSAAEVVGHSFDQLLAGWQGAAELGQGSYELPYERRDGTVITVALTVTAIRDDDDAISGFVAIGTDVTEHRAAEAKLQRAVHREQATVEDPP